jgi:hypothetical protein
LIPENVDGEMFQQAWIRVFDCQFNECQLEHAVVFDSPGLTIQTPSATIFHGGFIEHVDNPVLAEDQSFYAYCGCPWGIDLLGQRFYYIDPSTNLPIDWEEVKAKETIMRYEPFKIMAL